QPAVAAKRVGASPLVLPTGTPVAAVGRPDRQKGRPFGSLEKRGIRLAAHSAVAEPGRQRRRTVVRGIEAERSALQRGKPLVPGVTVHVDKVAALHVDKAVPRLAVVGNPAPAAVAPRLGAQ